MKRYWLTLLLNVCTLLLSAQSPVSLAGQWQVRLDPDSVGEQQQWYRQAFTQAMTLPGTTDQAGLGTQTSGPEYGLLSRAYKYVGPAWYTREITIPESWRNKPVELMLERVLWESKVWLDGKPIGKGHSLSTPHVYDLGTISPGRHRLTIRVNNDLIYNIGDKGHAYTEYTQSIWNGVTGQITLTPIPVAGLSDIRIDTDAGKKEVTIRFAAAADGNRETMVKFDVIDKRTDKVLQQAGRSIRRGDSAVTLSLTFQPRMWDEFDPAMYTLRVSSSKNGRPLSKDFAFRKVTTAGSKILINDKPIFLRGNLDCVHFPLTGYPSCEVKDWEKIFSIYKAHGLNHVRFHSWCPPDAAFEAADNLGIYIMAEVLWIDWWMTQAPKDRPDMITKGFPPGLGKNPSADLYVQEEMERIIETYGHHPSFIMFCIGNELGNSDFDVMEKWITRLKAKDTRQLYAVSTARKVTPADQYNVTHNIPNGGGTYSLGGTGTDHDLEKSYAAATVPTIAHEVGQFPVYPLWSEIEKYTGVLKARNLSVCYESAKAKGVAADDKRFHSASGALQQILYKELVENIYRTPSAAGFQLLSMQDYQGQGEALVGWLDAFYDTKGTTSASQFSKYGSAVVPLARFKKYVWTNNETFAGRVLLANYGSKPVSGEIRWQLKAAANGKVVQEGSLPHATFANGALHEAGNANVPLNGISEAGKYIFELSLGSLAANNWEIWVYPSGTLPVPAGVLETRSLDSTHLKALEDGKPVLFYAAKSIRKELSAPVFFTPLFWSNIFFPGQANTTLGAAVNHRHPALAHFPTDCFTNWQWEHISKGNAVILNNLPSGIHPIVQPISDFHINDKLGSLFECRVGKGKLMICGLEMDTTNAVARQLRYSLLQYMASSRFAPDASLPADTVRHYFPVVKTAVGQSPKEGQFKNALLHIVAGKNAPAADGHHPWKMEADFATAGRKTSYTVEKIEGIWRGRQSAGWYGKSIDIRFKVPQGVLGELYIHFYDWNGEDREAAIDFEGRSSVTGPLEKNGKWVKLFVMREDTNNGELVLKLRSLKGSNVMVDELVFVEQL